MATAGAHGGTLSLLGFFGAARSFPNRRATMNVRNPISVPMNLSIAATMAVIALGACHQEAHTAQRPPPEVVVNTIKPATIPVVYTFVAQTESSRQVDIVARVSGYLE